MAQKEGLKMKRTKERETRDRCWQRIRLWGLGGGAREGIDYQMEYLVPNDNLGPMSVSTS